MSPSWFHFLKEGRGPGDHTLPQEGMCTLPSELREPAALSRPQVRTPALGLLLGLAPDLVLCAREGPFRWRSHPAACRSPGGQGMAPTNPLTFSGDSGPGQDDSHQAVAARDRWRTHPPQPLSSGSRGIPKGVMFPGHTDLEVSTLNGVITKGHFPKK